MAGRIPAWAHAPKGILPCREICPFAQQLPRGQIRKRAPRYDNSPHAAEDTYLPISRNSFVSPPSTAPIACSDPPPWFGGSMCEDPECGVSQIARITSTSEIRYVSSCCAPAASLRGSVDQLAELEEYDTHPKSPTTIARAVSTTLRG